MTQLNFGAPLPGIMQTSFIVPDVGAAIDRWITDVGVGPWFLLDHFTGVDPVYRGGPSQADVTIAMAFAGHMQIELIQPNDEHPSVYQEVRDGRGWGFHHFGYVTADFEAIIAKLKEALAKSDKPERKQQAATWKVFRAVEPGPNESVLYVFDVDPAVKGADYTVSTILAEAFPPAEVNTLYKQYAEAYASGQNFVNLTLVAELGQ